ncbi:DUF5017 domain-containing protein [Pedobacter sp. UBA4863]|uniref:DUF5017 domain-containing protein n=1 Tax=Pedobacter sp. UBA4863 TaxID=1947060 RepID=UPI0025E9CAC6|nr:DUF5017 domain-containing protein [Pedobacter sp. UBA4863]
MKPNYYLFAILLFVLAACKKETKVEEVNFQVTADKSTIKVNEEARFSFEGNPGLITFYSGEPKNAYSYKDLDRIASLQQLNVTFESSIQVVTNTPLKVMFSTDYQEAYTDNGEYTYESVAAATWTDITNRFHMATTTYPIFDSSGTVNIADLVEPGKNFYIAFKYDTPALPATGTVPSRRWRFRNFKLEAITNFGFYERLAYTTVIPAGWKFARREPNFKHISAIGTIVQFIPPATAADEGYKQAMQLWAVSKAFAPTVNMGVDYGLSIKNYQTSSMSNYKHVYTKPGVYKATFVAANTNIYDSKKVVRELEITVEP